MPRQFKRLGITVEQYLSGERLLLDPRPELKEKVHPVVPIQIVDFATLPAQKLLVIEPDTKSVMATSSKRLSGMGYSGKRDHGRRNYSKYK